MDRVHQTRDTVSGEVKAAGDRTTGVRAATTTTRINSTAAGAMATTTTNSGFNITPIVSFLKSTVPWCQAREEQGRSMDRLMGILQRQMSGDLCSSLLYEVHLDMISTSQPYSGTHKTGIMSLIIQPEHISLNFSVSSCYCFGAVLCLCINCI